jgi:glycosyltransferase involved in cell wall biosynthesis
VPSKVKNQKKVSVVIPYFNGSAFMERALQSVYNQSHQAHEVIVVNDGSSEIESQKLEMLKQKYGFILLTQSNAGQGAARNYGVKISTSTHICFLDQDDFFRPNHIKDLLDAWDDRDENLGFVYGDLWRATEAGIVTAHSSIKSESEHPHKDLQTMIKSNMFILPSATLIRKDVFQALGGFDEQFRGYEDDDLFLRFFMGGYSNIFIDKPVTVWTLNPSSTSFSESMARSRYLYFQKLIKTFPPSSVPSTNVFGDLIVPRFAFQFAADVISSAFEGGKNFEERQMRLRSFREIFVKSYEVEPRFRKKYLIATYPLVRLSAGALRMAMKAGLRLSPLLDKTGLPGAAFFITRYRNLGLENKNSHAEPHT